MQPDSKDIDRIIEIALREDISDGDITSMLTIPKSAKAKMRMVTREEIIVCGVDIAKRVFEKFPGVKSKALVKDGERIKKGTSLMDVSGNARGILAAERTALNLIQHLSGIATQTSRFVREVKGTKARILDTRKTLPGFRALQKYAVHTGGGMNHRMGLYDGILIKDNHIHYAGGISAAVEKARGHGSVGGWQKKSSQLSTLNSRHPIEIECDTLSQVAEALAAGADIILLDNMDIKTLKKAVAMNKERALLEASGGVTPETVKKIAETGVDFISIGALTHSVKAVDIGLDVTK